MNIIHWKREKLKNIFLQEVQLRLKTVMQFQFTYSNKAGKIVLSDSSYWKKGIIGLAIFDNSKWILKIEREPFLIKIKLYNFDTEEYVARIRGEEFILKTGSYWIQIKKRYLLNNNGGKKLRLKVANTQQEIFNAWADYSKKSFFNTIYSSNLEGEIEYESEPNWEIIFSAFITMHFTLKTEQESD